MADPEVRNRGQMNNTNEPRGVDEAGIYEEEVRLKRQLGLFSGTALVVGSMIGSGIFISPAGILSQTQSVGMSLVIWVICGLVATAGALCYAELGTMIPKSGAEYWYFKDTIGGWAAFIYSWAANLVLKPSIVAIIILACADYAVAPLYEGTECGAPTIVVKLIAALFMLLVIAVNCISVRLTTFVINFFTMAKLVALAIIIVVGFIELAKGNNEYLDPSTSFKGSSPNPLAYALAFYDGLWAYDGWNQLNFVTEELVNPNRNLPLAISIGIPGTTVVYLLTNMAYFTVLSPEELLQSNAVAVTFGNRTLGPMAWIIPLAVVFSTFGAAVGALFTSVRLPYVAAREGHMVNILSMVHVRQYTPLPAAIFTGIVSLIMIIPGSIDALINYFSFAAWLFYGGAVACVIILRFTHPEWERPIKVPIIIPILFVLAAAYFVVAPIIDSPALEFLYAFIFIIAGFVPFFLFVVKKYELPFMAQSYQDNPTKPPPSQASHHDNGDSAHIPKRCSEFKDMVIEDQYRREMGRKRVFAKYCSPSAQTVVDNYCQCGVVPRSIDEKVFVDDQSARSFLSTRTETKNVHEECCNEACNLEEVRELSKLQAGC
ncbi:b(0,+)-type amino acid transporter 1-like [Amphiura filiformis]|uniref:b(0,+)-type amino acid transporter 1-like n=1 Tax=Amphiura filiformis TaxID=82378 RepID=UPI003B21759E